MQFIHYSDVIMSMMASQITSVSSVYSTIYSGTDQRKHQSSQSLAFVGGIHQRLVNSPHKGPVMWKMFPFDDIIMQTGMRSDMLPEKNSLNFFKVNALMLIKIWLQFVYKGPVDSKSTLVQVSAWPLMNGKSLPEPIMTHISETYMPLQTSIN